MLTITDNNRLLLWQWLRTGGRSRLIFSKLDRTSSYGFLQMLPSVPAPAKSKVLYSGFCEPQINFRKYCSTSGENLDYCSTSDSPDLIMPYLDMGQRLLVRVVVGVLGELLGDGQILESHLAVQQGCAQTL